MNRVIITAALTIAMASSASAAQPMDFSWRDRTTVVATGDMGAGDLHYLGDSAA